MEASSIDSLSPLISSADQWQELLLLLPVLVGLEVVLSADNAIALAAIAGNLPDPREQQRALNLGLVFALIFRIGLILSARWVLGFKPLVAAAAIYLLWLCGSHFLSAADQQTEDGAPAVGETSSGVRSLAVTALSIALTDLAFSLDSVAAAVAVSDRLALVISGGVIGVIALRLSSGLFIRLLQIHTRLEAAGYLAVGLVGMQLLLRLIRPNFDLPEWALLLAVAGLFLWGFSGPRNSPSEVIP